MGFTNLAAILCTAAFAAIALDGTSSANAMQSQQRERAMQSRAVSPPLLAIIALAQQRVSVYGASGKIMEAPVSTGVKGRETPAGIYSILEKEEEHHSNLYDDASMPFMQRLTWTGIAMHAGVLPGYAASHGCTRLSLRSAWRSGCIYPEWRNVRFESASVIKHLGLLSFRRSDVLTNDDDAHSGFGHLVKLLREVVRQARAAVRGRITRQDPCMHGDARPG